MKDRPFRSTARRALVMAGMLLLGVGAGIAVDRVATGAPLAGAGAAGTPIVVPADLQRPDLAQPFADFFRAYDLVTTQSYYAPLPDRKRLVYAAITGLLAGGTGDPHTTYVSPADNRALQQSANGTFAGLGAYIDTTTRGVSIIPLLGSPAAAAGLRPGDLIARIDGHDATTLTEDEVAALLRGPAGTRVTLGLQRAGVHGVFSVTVTRRHFVIQDVSSRTIGDVAYLRLAQFGPNTGRATHGALHVLLVRHPRGLVLDLRDNPGGLLDAAVDVNSQFLPAGRVILYERERDGRLDAPLRSLGSGRALAIPLVVLVNEGTASAAEITVGALHDNGRAKVVGVTTYGKGSVQQEYDQPDGAALLITTRLWLTPRQRLIQGRGITPDVVVDSPVADGSAADAQLATALRLLRSQALPAPPTPAQPAGPGAHRHVRHGRRINRQ